ncbi:hypothetical protein G6F24_015336 [Rhizopus arrhizus]|nr:hypothetical protein G6F24_015336 [Rhizopus arrhizus]
MAGVLEGITGMVADARGHLWLNGSRGLVRLRSNQLRRALRTGIQVTPRLFDAVDGMPGIALQSGPIATAALADDVLELSFALPPGCYATAVLHELGPVEDASQA